MSKPRGLGASAGRPLVVCPAGPAVDREQLAATSGVAPASPCRAGAAASPLARSHQGDLPSPV
jgi:hypothetical protein